MLESFLEVFKWENRDKRVDDWPMMDSPNVILILCIMYFVCVKFIGPVYMANREPYNVRKIMAVYNIIQIIGSCWIAMSFWKYGWGNGYNWSKNNL